MPDDQGRLSLKEIREAVWENLAAVYPTTVDPITGEASADPRIDPLFTKQALDRFINESLTAHSLDLMNDNQQIFEDSATLDVFANTPEVELPEDLAFVRSCWWKPANMPTMQAPQSVRAFMFNLDDPSFGSGEYQGAAIDTTGLVVPAYRLRLDFIELEPPPGIDNPGGVLVRYVKWVNHLVQDTQIIETQFARVLQECVILGASIAAAGRKAFMDTSELKSSYAMWITRLSAAAMRYFSPTSSYIATLQPIQLRGAAGGFRNRRFLMP